MQYLSRKKIATKTREILEEYDLYDTPIDVELLIRKLNIKLIKEDLEDEISGFLKLRGKNNMPVIVVNKTHAETRQRFTLAHELAHFFLHSMYSLHVDTKHIQFRKKESGPAVDVKEVQANQFAAELLMPRHILVNDLSDGMPAIDSKKGMKMIEYLAEKYQVSSQAMTIRLGSLLETD